ncbi:MAG: signal peptidase I, partial [Fimbriimonadales bacterium]|nr:signal peptidase I [Fimbriimonadales bacterium]
CIRDRDQRAALMPFPHLLAQTEAGDFATTIDALARTPLSRILLLVAVLTVVRMAIHRYLLGTPPHQRTGMYSIVRFVNDTSDAIIYAAILVFLLLRPFALQMFRIPSGSMVQTLMVNDFIVANKAVYRYSDPKVGDIVVFRPPKEAVPPQMMDGDGQVNVDFVKRCVGVPGQVIEIRNNVLYRDGKPVDEPYKTFTMQLAADRFVKLSPEEVAALPAYDFKLVKFHGKYVPLTYSGDFVNDTERTAPAFRVDDPDTMRALKDLPPAPIPPGHYLMMGDNRNGSFDSRGWGLVPRDAIIGRAEWVVLPFSRFGRPE